jgi:hypothetical protein
MSLVFGDESTIQLRVQLITVGSDCLAAMSSRQCSTLKGFLVQAQSSERGKTIHN